MSGTNDTSNNCYFWKSGEQIIFLKIIVIIRSCRREATTICPRPGLQVVTRYTSYTHLDPLLTRCPCWPASTANQSGLVTLTFDLDSGVPVTCDVGYLCANFSLPRPLCSRLRPNVRDRQTDVRQHYRLMPPPIRGGGIIITTTIFIVLWSWLRSLQEFTWFIWWMSQRQAAADPQTNPPDLGCESAVFRQL